MRAHFSPSEFLLAVAEPTRLRILALPQPTVSRHLTVLERIQLVSDTPIARFVLHRLHRGGGDQGA